MFKAVLLAAVTALPLAARVHASALDELSGDTAARAGDVPAMQAPAPVPAMKRAVQPVPPNNNAPGFDWNKARRVSKSGNKSVETGLPGTVKAFLDVIAYSEGTGDRYDYIFSFATFTDFSDHPRRVICDGICSDAAGRYQFLSTTWDELKGEPLNLPDFSPASQDKACVELIRRYYAYPLVADADNYDSFTAAIGKLNGVWASLPGSPYGQPTHGMDELWKVYLAAREKYK